MHSAHNSPPRKPHRTRRTGWKLVGLRLAAFFAVMGPGFITANVDNDPGGILTYSQAGAKFGYSLLWTLIPTTVIRTPSSETTPALLSYWRRQADT